MNILEIIRERLTWITPLRVVLADKRGIGLITGAVIGVAAGVAAGAVSASGVKSAAKTAAAASDRALSAQQRAAAEAQARRDEAVRVKREAAENIKFPTFLELPEAQKFSQTLQDRIAGRGLLDVDAATSPIAAQIRAGQERTSAAIGSAASARGLGRSSVVSSQISESSRAAERDINERMAQLELVRQKQIEDAIAQSGVVAEKEAKDQQNRALFKRGGEFEIADTIADLAQQTKADQFSISQTIQSQGALEAAYILKNAEVWASGILGAGETINSVAASKSILDAIKDQRDSRQTGALVDIATRTV